MHDYQKAKLAEGKAPLEKIDPDFVDAMARVQAAGDEKHANHHWTEGVPFSAVIGAVKRHVADIERGEEIDLETGEQHAAHAANGLMYIHHFLSNPEQYGSFDDRPYVAYGSVRNAAGRSAEPNRDGVDGGPADSARRAPDAGRHQCLRDSGLIPVDGALEYRESMVAPKPDPIPGTRAACCGVRKGPTPPRVRQLQMLSDWEEQLGIERDFEHTEEQRRERCLDALGCKPASRASTDLSVSALQRRVVEWSDRAIGRGRTEAATFRKFTEEFGELAKNPHDPDEYADCVILLFDLAHLAGISIADAVCRKLAVLGKTTMVPDQVTGVMRRQK